jgi:hypothetical protein
MVTPDNGYRPDDEVALALRWLRRRQAVTDEIRARGVRLNEAISRGDSTAACDIGIGIGELASIIVRMDRQAH